MVGPLMTRPGKFFSNFWGAINGDYEAQCFDDHPSCRAWATVGECKSNAGMYCRGGGGRGPPGSTAALTLTHRSIYRHSTPASSIYSVDEEELPQELRGVPQG